MKEIKTIKTKIELKEDSDETGFFKAIFSKFNDIDKDVDVTLPGAFTDGQKVKISYWGHGWDKLPVGKGTIGQNDEYAWVDGKFFLDTEGGLETYRTVKNLDDINEFSYGFEVIESDRGTFEGQEVRFLKRLDVFEVSPVMRGAGNDTRLEFIKNKNNPVDNGQTEENSDPSVDKDLFNFTIQLFILENDLENEVDNNG